MYHLVTQLLQPFFVLCLLTALGLLNLWRKRVESRRRLLLAAIPFTALVLLSTRAVAYLAIGSLEWQFPPRNTRPADAQAIVVLGGYMRPRDQVREEPELAEDTLCRCLQAAKLYHQGEPCPIVLSGGSVDCDAPAPTLAEVMRGFLLRQGVGRADLITEDQSRTTYENAVNSSLLLRERGIEKIVLVTDAKHLLRAASCFRARGLRVVPSGCRYRATQFQCYLSGFLPSPSAAGDMQAAAHEWLGMAWYWLHNRI